MAALSSLHEKTDKEWKLSARPRALGMLAALLLAGAAFSVFNVPLASSAANSLEVAHLAQAVPTDPQSPLWDKAKEAQIPLSAQMIYQYQRGGGDTREVDVRALEDGRTIAFRVSWNDSTRNDTNDVLPSDAAAIQLPIDPTNLPYQCMGQSSSRVNIWQWKAAFEKQGSALPGVQSLYSVGVRDFTSNGLGKEVDSPGTAPQVRSYHDGQQWHVVFWRSLSSGDTNTAPLVEGTASSIAFAIWNGANGEERAMKSVSTWNTLTFETLPSNQIGGLITLAVIVIASAVVVGFTMRKLAA